MTDQGGKTRYAYRLPPCSSYDVEGMESWLGDMANQGLLLEKDGFFCSVATFRRTEPTPCRYRLEAAPKSTSMWADDGGAPDEEAVRISEEYGWTYVANRGDFYIYRTDQPGVRELNTDPEVQALALQAVRKRQRDSLVTSFIWLILYPVLGFITDLFITMINLQSWLFLWGLAIDLWLFADSLIRSVHLGRLGKKLLSGEGIDHRKDWKKRAVWHYGKNAIQILMVVLWLATLLFQMGDHLEGAGEIPLSQYQGDPPFATIADFAPEGEHDYRLENMSFTNTIRQWSDWLAPVNFRWEEMAQVHLDDGGLLSGGLFVDYHETQASWIARALAMEYHRKDRWEKGYEPIELALPDLDYAAIYYDELHFPTAVLQKGNRVICASFYQVGKREPMPPEEWVGIIADSLCQ